MYTVKGFFNYPKRINNVAHQVAIFGELSSNSLSYSRDKLYFVNSELAPNTTFVVFHTVNDGESTPVPNIVSNHALQIGEFLLRRAEAGQIVDDAYVLRQQLNSEFASIAKDFDVGTILEDFTFRLPEWIRFTDLVNPDTEVTVWLADGSFSSQYDEFTIEVIPPIEPLSTFFEDPLNVKNALAQFDLIEKTDEIQAKRGEYPYTLLRTFRYDYVNPANQTDLTPTYWSVIIYGQAGNSPDLIREAIADYILSNSNKTREEWAVILPDLFKTTEFIFTPLFANYAVPNREFQAGIYSPTIKPTQVLNMAKRTARGTGYTDAYVTNQHEIIPHIYKSLVMAVVGNPDNREGIINFSVRWPQYILVSNNSPDFNRVSVETQEFMLLLNSLIVAAESVTPYSAVPAGLSRVTRDNVVYVSGYYKNINYMVVTKYSVEELF